MQVELPNSIDCFLGVEFTNLLLQLNTFILYVQASGVTLDSKMNNLVCTKIMFSVLKMPFSLISQEKPVCYLGNL